MRESIHVPGGNGIIIQIFKNGDVNEAQNRRITLQILFPTFIKAKVYLTDGAINYVRI